MLHRCTGSAKQKAFYQETLFTSPPFYLGAVGVGVGEQTTRTCSRFHPGARGIHAQVFWTPLSEESGSLRCPPAAPNLYSVPPSLPKGRRELQWKNERKERARVSRWCCEELAWVDSPCVRELFHALDEGAEWTESRVITLIDTLPPGSPRRANQGWLGGARSQAQVWRVFSSFSVIVLRQSVPLALPLPAKPYVARSIVNPTVSCSKCPAWGREEGEDTRTLPSSCSYQGLNLWVLLHSLPRLIEMPVIVRLQW